MNNSLGVSKHRKSGKVCNNQHFTGKQGGKKNKRKKRIKEKCEHTNKYQNMKGF